MAGLSMDGHIYISSTDSEMDEFGVIQLYQTSSNHWTYSTYKGIKDHRIICNQIWENLNNDCEHMQVFSPQHWQ